MPIEQVLSRFGAQDLAIQSPFVQFSEGVVQRLAVSKRLVNGRVKAIQEPKLELVSTLEEILQLAETKRYVRHFTERSAYELRNFGPLGLSSEYVL
jgi:hypothetical protein